MNKNTIVATIDIGSSKIATLIASVSPTDNKYSAVGVSSVPSKGIKKSQVVNIEEAIEAITQSVEAAERMAGVQISSALVSVSGDHIRSLNSKGVVAISNPEGEVVDEDVQRVINAAQAVSLPSSQEVLHVLPRAFSVDSQTGVRDPKGMSGVRLEAEAHIVVGSSAVIKNLEKCVVDINVKVEDKVFAGLSSAEAVLSDTEKELGVIVADIGGGTTSVVIYVDGAPSYSAVIPVGAKNITNDIAIGLRISLESAEKIKRHLTEIERKPIPMTIDHDGKSKSDKKEDLIDLQSLNIKEEIRTTSKKTLVEGIIRPRLNEIFELVGEELRKSGFGGMTPAGVVITGGGAETVEVLSSCKRVMQMPARIGYPSGLSGLTDEISSPAYASLTGLMLWHKKRGVTKQSGSMINFRPGNMNLDLGGWAGKIIEFVRSLLP